MGIKEITLPAPLIELPQPWAMTRVMERHKQLERLSYRVSEIEIALNVLNRCLCTVPKKVLESTLMYSLRKDTPKGSDVLSTSVLTSRRNHCRDDEAIFRLA